MEGKGFLIEMQTLITFLCMSQYWCLLPTSPHNSHPVRKARKDTNPTHNPVQTLLGRKQFLKCTLDRTILRIRFLASRLSLSLCKRAIWLFTLERFQARQERTSPCTTLSLVVISWTIGGLAPSPVGLLYVWHCWIFQYGQWCSHLQYFYIVTVVRIVACREGRKASNVVCVTIVDTRREQVYTHLARIVIHVH